MMNEVAGLHRIVALSAGDPAGADLIERGVGIAHLNDGVLRIARALLRTDLDIAYAGALRNEGFTTTLSDDTGKVVVGPRFISFLGWPYYNALGVEQIADTLGLCRYVRVESGPEASCDSALEAWPEGNWARAKANSVTRGMMLSKQLCEDINGDDVGPRIAQILIGGKKYGFDGVMPGLAEEFLCGLDSGLAVYIVGAFGGAASALADSLIRGKLDKSLVFESHLDNVNFKKTLEGARREDQMSMLKDAFSRLGRRILDVHSGKISMNNGLSKKENDELMTTTDLGRVVRLILSGLHKRALIKGGRT